MVLSHRPHIGLGAALVGVALAGSAMAQDGDKEKPGKRPEVSRDAPPSSNATINLINLLVKQGVLTQEQASALIKQANDEAYVARQAARDATAKADAAEKKAATAAAAASPPGVKRVTYVPEIVKQQLRDEIKAEVMAQAEKENWASPGKYPEWAQRIRFYGDLRVRGEGQFYPKSNIALVDYNAINTGTPYLEPNANEPNGSAYYPPRINNSEDRNRFRFRARLGADISLTDTFSAGLRLATGDTNSPVSLNQTFGGSGGNFSKYAIWIDRAFIKYQPVPDLTAWVGRFDKPFWSPTDLVWASDLGFDGVAVKAQHEFYPGVTPFVVAGAFPIYNTPLNASLNFQNQEGPIMLPNSNKWLFGAQIGVTAQVQEETTLTAAVSYFNFNKVQGQLSVPCPVSTVQDVCNTDLLRPSFAQKGNTYMWLRDIPYINTPSLKTLNYQYFGLASQFEPIVASGQLDFAGFAPIHVVLDAEYINNIAFDRNKIETVAVSYSNRGPTYSTDVIGPFEGGNQGWLARLTVGNKEIKKLWDWRAWVGYKYLESDAMVDAFVDSDFGLGGTNLKGYFVGGSLGLGDNVWANARWMSANSIAGYPYAVDVLQVDLNAKF